MMTRLAVRLPIEIKQVDSQWVSSLLPETNKITNSGRGVFIPKGTTLTEAEQILIDAALTDSKGNRTEAAKLLGMGNELYVVDLIVAETINLSN